ncbi:unnamed protein product, partial [Vitis vinifera]
MVNYLEQLCEVDEMIRKVDVNDDGHINYEEFFKVMMTNSLGW